MVDLGFAARATFKVHLQVAFVRNYVSIVIGGVPPCALALRDDNEESNGPPKNQN